MAKLFDTENSGPGDDSDLAFLAGGGEMGARMRAHHWTRTPLGDPKAWPHSLKAAVQIVLNSRFAMWMAWGPDLIFFCNDAYLPTVGIKEGWVLGARSDEVWAEIWPDIGPRIEHVLHTGEATWDEALRLYLERNRFSEETFHTFSYSPLANDHGQISGMLCVVAEVTERVISERQLAMLRDLAVRLAAGSTRSHVMTAFEACLAQHGADVPFALVYLGEPDRVTTRRAAAHHVDLDAPFVPDLISMHAADMAWPLQRGATAQATLVEVQPGDVGFTLLDHWQMPPRQAIVMPIVSSDADTPIGHLVAGLNAHRVLDDEYRGFLDLVVGQIAAAIARSDELGQARARAEALADIDRAKTTFFSNVSHEFRTPLTLMLGPLEELLGKQSDQIVAADRSLIDMAHRNGTRLLRLVNALLDFSRIEAGRAQANFEPTELSALTSDVASTFRSATERAGLLLRIDGATEALPVSVDRAMWETIILNLMSNAFKFTFAGEIRVSLAQADGQAVVRVSDTGTGIPAAELPKLFERFHRVAGAKGRSFEGSGIGLALVQDLVALHGGDIRVESDLGRGTTFTVTLPLLTGDGRDGSDRMPERSSDRAKAFVDEALQWLPVAGPPSDEPGSSFQPSSRIGGATILVADDNADMRHYIARLLRERGYAIETVEDGAAALTAVRSARPDMIVTDVMMPKIDGFELLHAVRGDPALQDLPVLILSARAGEEVRVDGLAAGADDYLTKPFSARELVARVDGILAMARLRRETADTLRALNEKLEKRVGERTRERDRMWALSRDPFLISDLAGRWLSPSPAWTELLGWSQEELVGRTSEWMEHPDDRARTRDEVHHIAAGDTTLSFENRFRGKDGTYRWFSWTAVSEEDVVYAVARDVTEAKKAAADLEAAQEALRQAQKMEAMGQLTGGVAHDFNNLLTPIVGSLDMLQRLELGGAREQRLIEGAAQSAERAKVLVQRLLAFARRQPLQSTAVDIAQLVRGMAGLMESTTGPQIRVILDVAKDLSPARADANQLEMALLNLGVNARDAMPNGGTLRISVSQETVTVGQRADLTAGDYVRLSVADTGIGMDEATLARAVEPFFSTKGVGKGTGLGLSMVHGLASQLGGTLTIQSRPNVGTNLELWLPVSVAQTIEALPATNATLAQAHIGSALLVDDEELVRMTTSDMLRDLGYDVAEAASAEEALQLVRGGLAPDLLVTDHLMPGMNGTDLARAVRAERPATRVLIVSGYADAEGVDPDLARLTKPFRRDELAASVAELARI